MRSTPLLLSLPGPRWPGVVTSDSVLSMGWIEQCTYAKLNCLKLNCLCRLSVCPNIRWWCSKYFPFLYRADLRSFEQSTENHQTPPALLARLWPQSCLLRATRSWSHLSPSRASLKISGGTQNTSAWHGVTFVVYREEQQRWCIKI